MGMVEMGNGSMVDARLRSLFEIQGALVTHSVEGDWLVWSPFSLPGQAVIVVEVEHLVGVAPCDDTCFEYGVVGVGRPRSPDGASISTRPALFGMRSNSLRWDWIAQIDDAGERERATLEPFRVALSKDPAEGVGPTATAIGFVAARNYMMDMAATVYADQRGGVAGFCEVGPQDGPSTTLRGSRAEWVRSYDKEVLTMTWPAASLRRLIVTAFFSRPALEL